MSVATSLSNADRETNYRWQEVLRFHGGDLVPLHLANEDIYDKPLTPAQNRRIRKHANKAKGWPEKREATFTEVPAEDITDLISSNPWDEKPALEAFNEAMETVENMRPCGGTEFCITKSGNKASKTHKGCEEN